MVAESGKSRNATSHREPRLAPAAGPLCQAFAATIPLVVLIAWFLWKASDPRIQTCNQQNISEACEDLRLVDMTAVCLVIAQLWACLAVYLSFFVAKRHEVILEYLEDGRTAIGDVVYQEERECGRFSSHHYGYVAYPHPAPDETQVYIRKKVHVLQLYTRERVAICLLPNHPFSGQPKADLEHDLAAVKRNKNKIFWLATLSWLWMIFATAAPVYLLQALGEVGASQSAYDMESVWIIYSVVVGLIIPTFAISLNIVVWKRYYHWLTKEGLVIHEDGQIVASASDCCTSEVCDYQPPSSRPLRDIS